MNKHKVKPLPNLGTGWYEYRGVRFYRDDSQKGYWGHYTGYIPPTIADNENLSDEYYKSKKIIVSTRALLLSKINEIFEQIGVD